MIIVLLPEYYRTNFIEFQFTVNPVLKPFAICNVKQVHSKEHLIWRILPPFVCRQTSYHFQSLKIQIKLKYLCRKNIRFMLESIFFFNTKIDCPYQGDWKVYTLTLVSFGNTNEKYERFGNVDRFRIQLLFILAGRGICQNKEIYKIHFCKCFFRIIKKDVEGGDFCIISVFLLSSSV